MILVEVIPEIIKQLNNIKNLYMSGIEPPKKQQKARPKVFPPNHLDYSYIFTNFVGIKTKTYEILSKGCIGKSGHRFKKSYYLPFFALIHYMNISH